ncbi:hypothetical protein VNO77_23178 [Canavalia gladiata]|uniref:DUF4408 domain-containing protein n=1 Tax=Canavalia gladiata TaxID=3824 RepID=A0AAN9L978_CANGL
MCEEAAGVSVYAVMSSWFTPSCLFILINLVIGTIAITSRFANNATKKQHQLERSSSLLDRVMSFNLRYYKHELTTPPSHCALDPVQSHDVDSNRLDRVSSLSLLDRVRSFNLGLCKGEKEVAPSSDLDDPTREEKLTRPPSLLERLKSVTLCRSESVNESEPESEAEEGVDAKADDFINRFRQQLKLQRLDSILRYRDMLKRN